MPENVFLLPRWLTLEMVFSCILHFLGKRRKKTLKVVEDATWRENMICVVCRQLCKEIKKDLLKHQTTSEYLDQLREHCPERPSPKCTWVHCTQIQWHKIHNDKNNKQQIIVKIMPVSGSWRHRWGRHRSKSRHRPNHRRASFQGLWARPARG